MATDAIANNHVGHPHHHHHSRRHVMFDACECAHVRVQEHSAQNVLDGSFGALCQPGPSNSISPSIFKSLDIFDHFGGQDLNRTYTSLYKGVPITAMEISDRIHQ
eukprot:8789507-Karenia_brevis.AAC.1